MGSTTDIYTHLQSAHIKAAKAAPALQQRFEVAGVDPARIASVNDLSCLPVLKKEELPDLQRQDPPFGGYLAARYKDLTRIYVSPGPIFEPTLRSGPGHGMDSLFRAAGVGANDVVLNT
ncbi:hypothetical protein [Roseovarius amoyensis]|uniref:hypothetical protein n=1 Tax=Roseovarius amoyensis TaxID=2211448 RepID=UPI000DBE1818|nr:hypothetical protein [Roseovarius amoyensis]